MEVTAFIWMFVVLKIPIAALLWLVWFAVKDAPQPVGSDQDDGGSKRPDRPHGPKPPRPPRRGPHHAAPLPAPPRVRTRAIGAPTTVDR
jgi:hypothetical protein